MAPKIREFSIDLGRDGPNTPWGIRLVGGSDLNTPLIITKVQPGSPANGHVCRGDIITKIQDYDARDIRNIDAQNLFRSAPNRIRLVIHRETKLVVASNLNTGDIPNSHCSTAMPPYRSDINLMKFDFNEYERAVSSLPQTDFQRAQDMASNNGSIRPDSRISNFSPMPTRDHQQNSLDEVAAIVQQPYRTTPLILPGAKVKKEFAPNDCYLRHHPNPAMRGRAPHVDEFLMRQNIANSALNRVVGDTSGKVAHKQFNSPIGLYSDNNIDHTIRSTVPNTTPYKKTVVFDPAKSETYRVLQEDQFAGPRVHEIPITVQHQTYHPAGKNYQVSPQQQYNNVNALGEPQDTIHQSHSFKRLMHSVLDDY